MRYVHISPTERLFIKKKKKKKENDLTGRLYLDVEKQSGYEEWKSEHFLILGVMGNGSEKKMSKKM